MFHAGIGFAVEAASTAAKGFSDAVDDSMDTPVNMYVAEELSAVAADSILAVAEDTSI